jgi:hypothetical protein
MNRASKIPWLSSALLLGTMAAAASWAASTYLKPPVIHNKSEPMALQDGAANTVSELDRSFQDEWMKQGLKPTTPADDLTIMRRLSLALTGSLPSLQELREQQNLKPQNTAVWWTQRLLNDPRTSDYVAERLARVYVGIEAGPFIRYRRGRLVDWLADALRENRPYDKIVTSLIAADGLWTTAPEVNFISVTSLGKKGPDEEKLAAKVSRAFLGLRMDCVQCHDGKLGSTWTQSDFHTLAAWFGQSDFDFTGLQDNPKHAYKHRYLGHAVEEKITPAVPWKPELLPQRGSLREKLAGWVTSPENPAFSRAMVNRMWALLLNRPLVSPVDDMTLEGPFPSSLEILRRDFTESGYNLHRLIQVITASQVFGLSSQSADTSHPVTVKAEQAWAAFPITRLRPEQMAGSVIQAASLTTLDADTHVIFRIRRDAEVDKFVKRYGDSGEDTFEDSGGTIPQRLLLMNGNLTSEHTANNPVLNASTRIALLAPTNESAVEAAYLSILTRKPSPPELEHFCTQLEKAKSPNARSAVMSDLCWTLLNCTEFSWNH